MLRSKDEAREISKKSLKSNQRVQNQKYLQIRTTCRAENRTMVTSVTRVKFGTSRTAGIDKIEIRKMEIEKSAGGISTRKIIKKNRVPTRSSKFRIKKQSKESKEKKSAHPPPMCDRLCVELICAHLCSR